jgi:DNA-binding NarL/FixJ family response regulator
VDGYPGAVVAVARAELARSGEAWSAVASALAEFPGAPAKLRWYVQARTAIADGDRAGLARVRHSAELAGYRTLLGPIDAGFGPRKPTDDPLTAREREVLDLVARGWSNRQIADQLRISPKTVSVHVSAILAKLGAATRTEAALHARRVSSA